MMDVVWKDEKGEAIGYTPGFIKRILRNSVKHNHRQDTGDGMLTACCESRGELNWSWSWSRDAADVEGLSYQCIAFLALVAQRPCHKHEYLLILNHSPTENGYQGKTDE
jgi:hypothetical protein